MGRQAAEDSLAAVSDLIEDTHLLFITAGMGGGTGTGAAPVIAQMARQAGVLTIGVVSTPWSFEGADCCWMLLLGVGCCRLLATCACWLFVCWLLLLLLLLGVGCCRLLAAGAGCVLLLASCCWLLPLAVAACRWLIADCCCCCCCCCLLAAAGCCCLLCATQLPQLPCH